MSPTRRAGALVCSSILLAFIAGVSAGVTGDRLLAPRTLRVRAVHDMSAVLDRLALTPEQRRAADSIVARRAPQTQAIMIEVGERLRRVADSIDVELRRILTPEQRTRLDAMGDRSPMLLKRKLVTPQGTSVDTVYDSRTTRP